MSQPAVNHLHDGRAPAAEEGTEPPRLRYCQISNLKEATCFQHHHFLLTVPNYLYFDHQGEEKPSWKSITVVFLVRKMENLVNIWLFSFYIAQLT